MSAKKPSTAAPQASIALVRDIRDHIEKCLGKSTGLSTKDCRTIAYLTLATHGLPRLEKFPILRLLGKPGCGKSETEKIIALYVRRPHTMSLRAMTYVTLRDELSKANDGTAIIEEADNPTKIGNDAFEQLISDRYSRSTATGSVKEQRNKGEAWTTSSRLYFGATILHRRIPYVDAALDGRTITIRFKPDFSRDYEDFDPEDETNKKMSESAQSLILSLAEYKVPTGLPGRIRNTWRPVLAVADLLGDQNCIDNIVNRHAAYQAAEFKEAHASEPDGLVLGAILCHIFEKGNVPDVPHFSNIKVSALSKTLWEEQRESMNTRQVAQIARELGFATNKSHGQAVVSPTLATLLAACESEGYSDPEIDKLRFEAARDVLVTPLESVPTVKESAKENMKEI
jgi:hypothetical protein